MTGYNQGYNGYCAKNSQTLDKSEEATFVDSNTGSEASDDGQDFEGFH